MKEPEVSVIVTAYNVELYLEACVRVFSARRCRILK